MRVGGEAGAKKTGFKKGDANINRKRGNKRAQKTGNARLRGESSPCFFKAAAEAVERKPKKSRKN